jgi:hypothetical protein
MQIKSLITLTLLTISTVSTSLLISPQSLAAKGCNPKYDKNGCADKGAPAQVKEDKNSDCTKVDCKSRGTSRRLERGSGRLEKSLLSKITQYEILNIGCKDSGMCGYVANDLKVGDTTNLVLEKPKKGFKLVTYTEVVNNF